MRRLVALVLATLVLSGCTQQQLQDIETDWEYPKAVDGLVEARNPDKIIIYRNVDRFPNVVILCIEGKAVLTSSTTGQARVIPDSSFDGLCQTG